MSKKKRRSPKKTQTQVQLFTNFFHPEIKGLILCGISFFAFLSIWSFSDGDASTNWLGLLGYITAWLCHWAFGLGSLLVFLFLSWMGFQLLTDKEVPDFLSKAITFAVLLISFCVLASLVAELWPEHIESFLGRSTYSEYVPGDHLGLGQELRHYLGGVPFYYLYQDIPYYSLQHLLNNTGTTLVFGFLFLSAFCRLTRFPVVAVIKALKPPPFWRFIRIPFPRKQENYPPIQEYTNLLERPSPPIKEDIPAPEPKPYPQKPPCTSYTTSYTSPPLTLLANPKKNDQSALKKDLRRQAEILEETLHSFGIEAKVGQINCGPTITSFEVHPSIGVKVQKIRSLEHDIALNMEAKSIRIIAPIPGKAAVGIEVPNPYPQEVSFKEILRHYQQNPGKFQIPVLLGKTVHGEYVITDLTKMPHCVIAGATGSGKSVCINTIVMSLLMTARPDEVRLIMVDPKKVELTAYSKLPHMIAPVITEPQGACVAFNWLVKEMEKRYELLKAVGVRNILNFNNRHPDTEKEESLPIEIPLKLPYIVGIIDELADLMMVSQNDIETPIARIAQMARAVGIHLILATQRPSREVITGLIKANFPTRIAFKVSSRINSQIILDSTGAETLLGNGDMLFLPPGASSLIRAQGAFICDEDITAIIQSIEKQSPPDYLIDSFDNLADENASAWADNEAEQPADRLYDEARQIVLSMGSASTSFLQRKLKIGYNRAATLMEQLEDNGVVGAADGAKPRKVLCQSAGEEMMATEDHADK